MPATRKRPKHRPETTPQVPQPGFWESTARPWIEKRALPLALCLIVLAAVRIAAAYPENGITFDEPGHMACGLQLLAQHVYRYESQHPPLARVMSALGPYLDGARPMGIANQDQEGVHIMYRDAHVLRTLVLMRLGILPFFVLACLVVYFWAARYFGKVPAVVAAGLFSLMPPVLAHGGVATTDMPVAACMGLAFLCLMRWVEAPSLQRGLALGGATGLMALSKFTALAFFPAAAGLALIAFLATQWPGAGRLGALARDRALPFGIAVTAGALVIWAGYLFSIGKVPGWGVALPAPEVFDGVRSALQHNDRGHMAYLLGHLSTTGWWYYFPVALAVKTPIAFLLLLPLGGWATWRRRRETAVWLPWAFALGILIPAMMGRVNIGVRHILPVYIGFAIIAALGLVELLQWRRWTWAPAAALLLWMAASGALQHPDYLGYFNEIAIGNPSEYLVDSDLDWGQDTVRLARWLKGKGISEVSFVTMNLSGEQLQVWPGLPLVRGIDAVTPSEGWTVVSPTLLVFNQFGLNYRFPNLRPWFESIPAAGREGPFLLYYVPPGALKR